MIWNISRLGSKRVIQGFIVIFTVVFIVAGIGVLGLNKLSKSLNSVYKNSLIPERDLATITKLQYDNRFHLEELLTGLSASKHSELLTAISSNNQKLDAILDKHINDDYFIPVEKEHLKQYQRVLKQYRILERKVISLHETGKTDSANIVFKFQTYVPFSDAIKRLDKLEDEELSTGAEEVKTTLELANQVRLLMYVAVFVAILIAVLLGTVVGRSIIDR
jgi:CHASE3 domain sensor protein